MIVIEGPDGAGKTTLARKLVRRFNLELSPHSQLSSEERKKLRERNQREFIYGAISDALRGDHPVYVHDRVFFSHLVYQPILDGRLDLTPREILMVRQVLAALHIPIVMCIPPFETVRDNVESSDQMAGVRPHIRSIYDAYLNIVAETKPGEFHDVMWYDYTDTRTGSGSYLSVEQIYDRVARYLERRKERSWK